MKELFEKIFIHSETDLPTSGRYIVCRKSGEIYRDYPFPKKNNIFIDDKRWLEYIDWYLRPVTSLPEITDQTIDEAAKKYVQNYSDTVRHLSNYARFDFSEGAKWARDKQGMNLREEFEKLKNYIEETSPKDTTDIKVMIDSYLSHLKDKPTPDLDCGIYKDEQ